MTRLKALDPNTAKNKTKELFNAIENKLGIVPNMMRTMGNSPALLEGALGLSAALGKGSIDAKTGELIAIAVAESNACDYCLSAHTYVGANMLKIDAVSLDSSRRGNADSPKTSAALQFAKTLVEKRGLVSDADVDAVKAAGFTDGEIGEIIGHVGLNILSNYFNNTAKTEIDFPAVAALQTVAV